MKFIWGGDRAAINRELHFFFRTEEGADELLLAAADFYRVFAEGTFVSYGPDRTAAGFARPRRIPLGGAKEIEVIVSAYNAAGYSCDLQLPYFGAQVFRGGELVGESGDFACYRLTDRREDVPRYSFQRGFLEIYDLTAPHTETIDCYEVEGPRLLPECLDRADYCVHAFEGREGGSPGFDEVQLPFWLDRPGYRPKEGSFDVERDFLDKLSCYTCYEFELPEEEVGFLQLFVAASEEAEVFACFDEFLPDGKWVFGRSSCFDLVGWTLPDGIHTVMTAEPYVMKHLKLFIGGEAQAVPTLIGWKNGTPSHFHAEGDSRFCAVFRAAEETFRKNAVDIYMDCPGRERAGWLCDSYFTAQAERLFTGKSEIERCFLENFLLGETPEIEQGMLPMCFPSESHDHTFIPNWAMWYVLELFGYFSRTGDESLVLLARPKIEALLSYFAGFENEEGLLEDLRGWVFLEWSVSNDPDYVKGVNFPSNMLYAKMLGCAGALYGREDLKEKAARVRSAVQRLSFDGTFYCDNAVRAGDALVPCRDHISETCQYYALFCSLPAPERFRTKMAERFGPFRSETSYPEVGRSNAFIGNFLRFFWLSEAGERERVIGEMLDYFYAMARETGTLWEHNAPTASCCHGFASAAAVLLANCLCGYRVEGGKTVFALPQDGKRYGVKLRFGRGEDAVEFDC